MMKSNGHGQSSDCRHHFVQQLPATSVLLVICLMTVGCGGSPKAIVNCQIERKNGSAVMTIQKLTVVFENISWNGADQKLSTYGFHIPTADETREEPDGGFEVKNGEDKLTIKEWWSNGVSTISFNDYSFQMIEDGTKLKFDDKTFAIGDKSTIVVAEDGTMSVYAN